MIFDSMATIFFRLQRKLVKIKLLKKIYLLLLLLLSSLAALGLHCCAQAFSLVVRGLLTAVASCRRARALGTWASVVVARGLSSRDSWALEHRISSCGSRA